MPPSRGDDAVDELEPIDVELPMTWRPEQHEDVQEQDTEDTASSPLPGDDMLEVELDALITQRKAPRRRVIQMGMLAALLFVVGVLVYHNANPQWQSAQPAATSPDSPDSPDSWPMDVEIYTNVTNATLTLNGKKLATHLPAIVTLRQGTNTITVTATPFQQHTCTVGAPTMNTITGCSGFSSQSPPITIGNKHTPYSLFVPFTVTDLPSVQRASVQALVQQTLDTYVFDTTVPAHQYIATGIDLRGHITSRLTTTPLRGEVSLILGPDPNEAECADGICPADNGQLTSATTAGMLWTISVEVAPRWRFMTSSGSVVATSSVENMGFGQLLLTLAYGAAGTSGSWTIPAAPDGGIITAATPQDFMAQQQCEAGVSVLSTEAEASAGAGGVGIRTQPHGLEGCQLQLLGDDGKTDALFNWRFGVLLAADSAAHARLPGLPIAPQAEIDAVIR